MADANEPTSDLEVEWQFDCPDLDAAARWLESARVPGYVVAKTGEKRLEDTYYDTEDWRLNRAGFTCRVRRKRDGDELTLKTMAEAVGAVRSRTEITEMLASGFGSEPAAAPGRCGEMVRLIAGRHVVRPIFVVITGRTTFDLHDDSGTVAEVAVDDTSIPAGEDAPARLRRIEVEVRPGATERAQRFVDVLVATAKLMPAAKSKFGAALDAAGLAVTSPGDALGTETVDAGMTAAEAGFAILRRQFRVFLRNEGGTRLGQDIEALHDMRVATRRMRAAMSAFGAFLPPRVQVLRAELGWVAAALGGVRDLDVQLERMAEWRGPAGEERSHTLDGIEALLAARREKARRVMLTALDSRRYDRLVERMSVTLRRGAPRSFVPGLVPLLDVAPNLVEKRYRRVRRLGDAIVPVSPPERYHELRIEAKKLRYALEFVGPVYGRQATDFGARVTALQDVLGLHQDAYVAVAELEEMATASARRLGPAALLAMGGIVERYRLHAAELRAQFPKVYVPLGGGDWRALRKLMESRRTAPR